MVAVDLLELLYSGTGMNMGMDELGEEVSLERMMDWDLGKGGNCRLGKCLGLNTVSLVGS
jgi:hypothetical protein